MPLGRPVRFASYCAAMLAVSLLASSCSFFNSLFGLNKDDDNKEPASNVVTVYTLIGDMSSSLVSKSLCSAAEAKVIADGANAAVSADGSTTTNFEALIPVAVGGAVGSLEATTAAWGASADADAKRGACVEGIIASFVTGMNGKFVATTEGRSVRALSDSAAAVNAILARISKAAVSNLAKSGITAERRATTASGVVSTMIGSLAGGGVNKVLVSDAVSKITQGAVEMLVEAGCQDALATAVTAITQGAVSAISSITVSGVASADYSNLATEIAKGAAAGVGVIATSDTVSSLAGAVATGAAKGVLAVQASSSLDAATTASMVQGVSSGATTGVMSITSIDVQSVGTTLIGSITSCASTALKGASDEATIQAAVATGASAAAQTALTGSHDAATLAAAITINSSADVTVDKTAAISAGVTIGTNHSPVVSAGSDKSVAVGEAVTITGTATDADLTSDPATSNVLTYAWTVASKPATSPAVVLSSYNTLSTGFTPSVAGTYRLSLKVTDATPAGMALSTVEAFCAIQALASTDTSYGGMTAAERLASATSLMDQEEYGAARDELLTLLTYYPVTELNGEAVVRLGHCYDNLGSYQLAAARYLQAIGDFPDNAAVPNARNALGWVYLNHLGDTAKAKEQFAAVAAMSDLKTREAPNAIHGLGDVELKIGNYEKSIEYQNQAMDPKYDAYTDVYVLFWSQHNIAQAYEGEGSAGYAKAETAFAAIQNNAKFTQSDPTKPSTVVVSLMRQFYEDWGWLKYNEGKVSDQVALYKAQSISTAVSYPNYVRLRFARLAAERELWDLAETSDNFTLAKSELTAALGKYSGSDANTKSERDWAQLRLGQANSRLADNPPSAADKAAYVSAAKAAFDLVAVDLGTTWGTRQAGEAMVEKASVLLWKDENYSAAAALAAKVVSSYPADYDQYPMAYAYFMLGQTYRQQGWYAKNNYGQDYVDSFQKAIFYYSKVTTANYPSLSSTQWFFAQALWQIGDSYSGEDQYATAISSLTPLLSSSSFTNEQKAQMQLTIAKAYGEEIRALADEGEFAEITGSLGSTTNAAFEAVSTYYESDGTTLVDNGDTSAQAWYELARLSTDVGQQMEDAGYNDLGSRAAVWHAGIDAAAKCVWSTDGKYKNLDSKQWYFYYSRMNAGRCYEGLYIESLANWDTARTTYNAVLSDIAAGTVSTERKPEVLKRIARSWQREAEKLDGNAANQANIIAYSQEAITEYAALFDSSVIALDDGDATAWSLGETIWCYRNMANALNIDGSQAVSDVIATREGYIAAVKTLLDKSWAYKKADGSTLVENGKPAAWGATGYGFLIKETADNMQGYSNTLPTGWETTAIGYYDSAISWFDKSDTTIYSGAQPYDVMNARQGKVQAYLSKCQMLLDQGKQTEAGAAFDLALDVTASLISDAETLVEFPARAIRDIGWAFISDGARLVGCGLDEFASEAAWRTSAETYFKMVTGGTNSNAKYAAVDGGDVGTRCAQGLTWLADNPATNLSVARSASHSLR
jgi:hypothetical protein